MSDLTLYFISKSLFKLYVRGNHQDTKGMKLHKVSMYFLRILRDLVVQNSIFKQALHVLLR